MHQFNFLVQLLCLFGISWKICIKYPRGNKRLHRTQGPFILTWESELHLTRDDIPGGVLPICGIRGCATWQVWFGRKLPYIRVHIWDFALKKGPFLAPKVYYKRVLFCWKLKFHPWKMHVLPTSNVKFSESQVNHTFLGTFSCFCLLFLKFA